MAPQSFALLSLSFKDISYSDLLVPTCKRELKRTASDSRLPTSDHQSGKQFEFAVFRFSMYTFTILGNVLPKINVGCLKWHKYSWFQITYFFKQKI